MTERLDLPRCYRDQIETLLREYVPGVEVWAYGSRVSGRSHKGSDLDLVLRGPDLKRIPSGQLADLTEALEESNVPIIVQAHDWARLPENFHREIEREYMVLVGGQDKPASRSIGDYFILKRGTTYKSLLLGQPGPVLLGLATIQRNGGFRSDSLRTYGGDSPKRLLVEPGQIYVSLKDVTQSADLLGAVARLPIDQAPGRLTQDTVKLERIRKNISTDYIYWLLRTPQYRAYCRAHATGTTNLGLSRDDFLAFPVPNETNERRGIVDTLTALDDKIELNRRMNETLEEMARALFKSWFVDFDPVRAKMEGRDTGLPPDVADLFPDRLVDSELGEIPEGWEVKTVGTIASIVGGTTPSTKQAQYWEGGTHCWATPKDLASLSVPVLLKTERKITDAGLGKIGSGLLPPGTVLLSSRAPIGYLAIAETPAAINQGFIGILPHDEISNLFMLYWCEASHDKIINHANGSTFLEISKSNFRQLPVVVPDESAMKKFDDLARPLYNRIVSNERQFRSLSSLRDTLLPKLISGEVRVENAETFLEECRDGHSRS